MQQQSRESIQDHLWWVIPEQLAGIRKPNPEEVPKLQALGIKAVSVMDDPSNLDLYEQANLPYLWIFGYPLKGTLHQLPKKLTS